MIELFKTAGGLKQVLDDARHKGHSVGFVPTMGALHRGHLSLVDRAALENDIVVVSIFVNPNQFNDPNDLKNYPRNLEKDIELLKSVPCNCVFAPSAAEIYPEPDTRKFDFGTLENVMEGRFRPGHFNGVAQVVSKLFKMVEPHRAYFGRKDFQQLAIVKNMVAMMNMPVTIVACDTVREPDGLAMSSRNALLSPVYRAEAPLIYRTLQEAHTMGSGSTPGAVKQLVIEKINASGILRVEYFEIVDEKTLQPVDSWVQEGVKVGCIAVFAGPVRLIDNIVFEI